MPRSLAQRFTPLLGLLLLSLPVSACENGLSVGRNRIDLEPPVPDANPVDERGDGALPIDQGPGLPPDLMPDLRAAFVLAPPLIDFGMQFQATPSPARTAIVTNTGAGTGTVSVLGDNAAGFILLPPFKDNQLACLSQPRLEPGAWCELYWTFVPGRDAEKSQTSTRSIALDGMPVAQLTMVGEAVEGDHIRIVLADGPVLRSVYYAVKNLRSTPTATVNISLSGTGAKLSFNTCGRPLEPAGGPAEQCTFTVEWERADAPVVELAAFTAAGGMDVRSISLLRP